MPIWLFALGGGILGGISRWNQGEKEKAALEHQKNMAWQQYQYGKEYSDNAYNLQKSEALDQLGMQRRNLDTQLNTSMSDYNTSLLAQAFGIQDARIQSSSAIGESLAAEGASGARGNASNEMIRAYASQSLDRNIDLQNRQNSNYLNQLVSGANMTSDAISREQASWLPGGYRAQAKDLQDAYNLNIANLGQDNFNWQIEQAQPGVLDYITSILGGASSGFSMGAGIDEYRNNKNTVNQANLLSSAKNNVSSLQTQNQNTLSSIKNNVSNIKNPWFDIGKPPAGISYGAEAIQPYSWDFILHYKTVLYSSLKNY